MENMWEFFLVFYFVPYKVKNPMHAAEFFYVFVPCKVNIPMYAGGFKQVLYKEYICWIQVKIHISDQTSLRICKSVYAPCHLLIWTLKLTLKTTLSYRDGHPLYFPVHHQNQLQSHLLHFKQKLSNCPQKYQEKDGSRYCFRLCF